MGGGLLTNQKISRGAHFRIEPTCIIITLIVSKNSSTEPSSGQFPVKTKILASVILEHKGLVFAMDSSKKVIVSSNGNMEAGPLSVIEIPQNVRKRMSSLYQVFIPHYVDNKSCQGNIHILRSHFFTLLFYQIEP